ncbi:immunity protein YezG family protein [Paenibacillus silvae]|uniref:TIGR01741 family protein n=1 Tax=Paenibacillus silvae TaxID=1325358 RepID=A0A2W6QE90_9BACL|nr:immunity protein YezG family protein [Paenibacillus silvae]PZT55553.1 TIGR01741 family protein [Paenibacillus silvae]
MEKKMNELYRTIAEIIDRMIPVQWEDFYFNEEVENGEGGVFFFFKPENESEYIYSLEIPGRYNVNSDEYDQLENKLFEVTNDLKNLFLDDGQDPWFSMTMKLTSEGKLSVVYDYTKWGESTFGPSERLEYWESKYLGHMPEEEEDRIRIEKMKDFEERN